MRYRAPRANDPCPRPLDASAITLIRVPSESSIVSVISPLVDLVGRVATIPLRRTSRPSVDSLGPAGGRSDGAGTEPVPIATTPAAAGRISSWPYGSASGPVTSSIWPRDGVATPLGSLTTMPPVASAIASSAGVPSRPASAVTAPRTTTVEPTDRARAAAIVDPGHGLADGDGLEVAAGVGLSVAIGVAVGSVEGVGVGSGVGVAVGVGVGVGVGGGSTARSPACVT